MTNRLANETSPYLRQHAENPVGWYPWGEEALQRARDEDKPLLLSIGYAACHWCHVMAHESFEDPATAAIMNQHYVNIKIDREERPDLDSIYMSAVQAMTGQGGWPMTVFATPDGRPFYGGTYYPPVPRHGLPSFKQVLLGMADIWEKQRDEIEHSAGELALHLEESSAVSFGQGGSLNDDLLDRALNELAQDYDARWGGFSDAPKFPPSMTLEFLLRVYEQRGDATALRMVEHTLEMMARGGIYDQVGGGFARYSTDNKWLAPHFEKMLYDNALLARIYLHAWQVTGKPLFRRVVEETLDFIAREMRHGSGGFFSSYDADSEGVEGKFYVWSTDEIRAALGPDADLFMAAYDVTEQGNWEGHNILHLPLDLAQVAKAHQLDEAEMRQRLAKDRDILYEIRARRVRPGLDDKVLTAWNGLALAAFAEAGRALGRADYIEIATLNAEFLYAEMRQANGRLLRSWQADAGARYNGYLEDYAFLATGLLALYQTTFEVRWFVWARELADLTLAHFRDEKAGGFSDTSNDHETLLYRPRDLQDNAMPSGNSMAAQLLIMLNFFTGEGQYWDTAEPMVSTMHEAMGHYPAAFSHWLTVAAMILGNPQELAIAGDLGAIDTQAMLAVVNERYRPNLVVAAGGDETAGAIALLADRPRLGGQATAYVCRQFVCRLPVTEPGALAEQLNNHTGD